MAANVDWLYDKKGKMYIIFGKGLSGLFRGVIVAGFFDQ